jgi:hypothetical protein
LVYGYIPTVHLIQDTLSYPEFIKFFEHKSLKEDCTDIRKCVERMLTDREFASYLSPFYASYVAREMGTVDVGKVLYSLDEPLISGGLTLVFKKGNPLLDRFNTIMRRYLEAGLQERIW